MGTFTLHLGADEITVEIEDQTIMASRKPASAPTAIIASGVCTLRVIVCGGPHSADPGIAPHITITGDRPAAHRFLAMFACPEAASTERDRRRAAASARSPLRRHRSQGLNRGPVGHADLEDRGLAEHRQGAGGLGQRHAADVAGSFPGKP